MQKKEKNPIVVRAIIGFLLVAGVVTAYLVCEKPQAGVSDTRKLSSNPVWNLPDLELRVLFLVNLERTDRDLHPLMVDRTLTEAARWQARYNRKVGYLDHFAQTPGMKTTGDRIRKLGGKEPSRWGENLAVVFQTNISGKRFRRARVGNQSFKVLEEEKIRWRTEAESARIIFQSWMNSPPHKKGLLKEEFYKAGSGIVQGTYREEKAFYAAMVFSGDLPGLTLENFAYRKKQEGEKRKTEFFLKVFNRPGLEPVVFGYGNGRIVEISSRTYRDGKLFRVPPDDENDMIYRFGAKDPYQGVYYPVGRVAWAVDRFP